MDIGEWLRSLGLERYTPTFLDNAIGSDVLFDLTEADLEKLEIPLGDRKRLMKAFKVMVADAPDTLIANGVWTNARSGQPHAAVAERRHLTVMICDLVGQLPCRPDLIRKIWAQ